MTRPAMPIDEFNEKIGENGALISKWPFSSLTPLEEVKTAIGHDHETTDGIAVGHIEFVRDDAATLRVCESDYRTGESNIRLRLKDVETAKRWRQLVGITIAAEVTFKGNDSDNIANFSPDAILAVTPPMTHPDHAVATRLAPRSHYVHGIVTNMLDVPTSSIVLASPDTGPIALNYASPLDISTPAGRSADAIQPGHVIRAGVNRKSDIQDGLYLTDGRVHILGRIAGLAI